jgi:hypothetical protein
MADKLEFSSKELVSGAIGLVAALAGLFVEDFLSACICLGLAWMSLVLVCVFHKGSGKARLLVGLAITAVFVAVIARLNYNQESKERENVATNIKFSAAPVPSDLRNSVFTIANGGSVSINFRFTCRIKMLVGNGGTTVVADSVFENHERSGVLDKGSDAQSDDCLSDISGSMQIIDCVDVDLRVFYSLTSQPTVKQEIDHGFVARKREEQFAWEDRSTRQEKSDCEQSVTRKIVSFDDQVLATANVVRQQDNQIIETVGASLEKKKAATLSIDIFNFGDSIKDSIPKEVDMQRDGMVTVTQYQHKFAEWGSREQRNFHSRFDVRINQAADFARRHRINPDKAIEGCTVISQGYPPTVRQTQLCGSGVGQLAALFPWR